MQVGSNSDAAGRANLDLTETLTEIDADAVILAGGGHYRGTWDAPFPTIEANLISQIGIIAAVTQARVPKVVSLGSYWQDMVTLESSSPASLYRACKNATEALLASAVGPGIAITTLHLHDVYGPNDDRDKIFGQLIQALSADTPLSVKRPHAILIPVHIRDVCSAVEVALSRSSGLHGSHETYRVDGDEMISVRELIGVAQGINSRLRTAETEVTCNVGDPNDIGQRCIHDRPLGWQPLVTLKEGLCELVNELN